MLKKWIAGLVLVLLCVGPATAVVSLGAFMGPTGFCFTDSLTVGQIPESLTSHTSDGVTVTLGRQQLTHAATIITTGASIPGVGQAGVKVALMAALTESQLRMLTNVGAYPESASYPHDGDASDHDSLGLFQMRPAAGWGTVSELMDPVYQAKAFFGGPGGPNFPSPRGLLDIPGWQQLDPGAAAQAVEVSAYPDRYQVWRPVAEAILTALTVPSQAGSGGNTSGGEVPETSKIVFPLPEGSYSPTDSFGWRTDPISGGSEFHSGSDLAALDGTPIFAVADGRVTTAGVSTGWGGRIVIDHTVRGQRVSSSYVHMWGHGIHVSAGEMVAAGQHIGDVGSSGRSTGPHLHLEIRPGGAQEPAVDALEWLAQHGVVPSDGSSTMPGCGAGWGAR